MNIGILLWNTCNAKCAHCAVSSGPNEQRALTNTEIKGIVNQCFLGDKSPSIGLSGGEAFLFYDDLLDIVQYAARLGASVAVTTNCFWAISDDEACRVVNAVKAAGLRKLVVSTDTYHTKYINEEFVVNAVRACKKLHLEVDLQFISSRKTKRLSDFLSKYGDDFLNVACREIPCHPVGRASLASDQTFFYSKNIPSGKCPNAVLSVSADGRYIPCCNTAGHLEALEVGKVGQDQAVIYNNFLNSPIMNTLWEEGPASLIEAAESLDFKANKNGYIDQCHLCHDLFRDPQRASLLKDVACSRAFDRIYQSYKLKLDDDILRPTQKPAAGPSDTGPNG